MPNRTIYVADADQEIFDQAQQLAGDNVSSVIVRALKEFIARYERKKKGLQEIVVHVGSAEIQVEKRFWGQLLFKWNARDDDGHHWLKASVYRTAKGKWAISLTRDPWSDSWMDWRSWTGLSGDALVDYSRETELLVFDSIQDAQEKVPTALLKRMEWAAEQETLAVEFLDI